MPAGMTALDLEQKLDAIRFDLNALIFEVDQAVRDDGAGRPKTDRLTAMLAAALDQVQDALQANLFSEATAPASVQRELQKGA